MRTIYAFILMVLFMFASLGRVSIVSADEAYKDNNRQEGWFEELLGSDDEDELGVKSSPDEDAWRAFQDINKNGATPQNANEPVRETAPSGYETVNVTPATGFEVPLLDSKSTPGSFSEIGGLELEPQPIDYRTGTMKETSPVKMPGIPKYSDIHLKRGVLPSAEEAAQTSSD